MPAYCYECPACGHRETRIIKVAERKNQLCGHDPAGTGEECRGHLVQQVAPATFILQGRGWYKDGYS